MEQVSKWLVVFIAVVFSCQTPRKPVQEEGIERPITKAHRYQVDSTLLKEAKTFCETNAFNPTVAFFTDMSLRSGRRRFFVVNLDKDSIVDAGLVTHGHCQEYASRKPHFSNEIGSNCTSIGKYKIGYKYDGSFGTAYKLFGLDTSNSNAFDRFVVLHSHSCVPEEESVVGICRSEGCPTVSPEFLARLETIIDASPSPILLWVFGKKE